MGGDGEGGVVGVHDGDGGDAGGDGGAREAVVGDDEVRRAHGFEDVAHGVWAVGVEEARPVAEDRHRTGPVQGGVAAVVGTTGLSDSQLEAAGEAGSEIPLLIAPNMSLGVNLMFRTVEEVARALKDFDPEIVEIHHNRKKDSPSGTAVRLAEALERARPGLERVHGREGMIGARKANEIGIHSLRGGDVVGEHTVIFSGEGERFEITHRAHSRRTFARGAIRAVRFLAGKPAGLYSMSDVLGLSE